MTEKKQRLVFAERGLPLTIRAWIIYRNFKYQQRVKKTLVCLNKIELFFKDLLMQNHSGTCHAFNQRGMHRLFSSLISRKYTRTIYFVFFSAL